MRSRGRLVDYTAAHIQHMQKALTYMNIQLDHVISDLTGMKIIRAILDGEKDPKKLAEQCDMRRKPNIQTIEQALSGRAPFHVKAALSCA